MRGWVSSPCGVIMFLLSCQNFLDLRTYISHTGKGKKALDIHVVAVGSNSDLAISVNIYL